MTEIILRLIVGFTCVASAYLAVIALVLIGMWAYKSWRDFPLFIGCLILFYFVGGLFV